MCVGDTIEGFLDAAGVTRRRLEEREKRSFLERWHEAFCGVLQPSDLARRCGRDWQAFFVRMSYHPVRENEVLLCTAGAPPPVWVWDEIVSLDVEGPDIYVVDGDFSWTFVLPAADSAVYVEPRS